MDDFTLVTMVAQFINELGFPIVACVYMILVNNKTVRENTKATQKMCQLLTNWIQQQGGDVSDE